MTGLGNLDLNGWAVPKDYIRARQWYEKAAAGGESNAMTNLGVIYQNGWSVSQSYAEARQWFEKSAAKGDIYAEGVDELLYGRLSNVLEG